MIRKCTT